MIERSKLIQELRDFISGARIGDLYSRRVLEQMNLPSNIIDIHVDARETVYEGIETILKQHEAEIEAELEAMAEDEAQYQKAHRGDTDDEV